MQQRHIRTRSEHHLVDLLRAHWGELIAEMRWWVNLASQIRAENRSSIAPASQAKGIGT